MTQRQKWARAGIGFLVIAVILISGFAYIMPWLNTYGSTVEEQQSILPGDEQATRPSVNWTHGVTIYAPVDEVWQWLAQMGDTKAAFYSYTFIENLIANTNIYHNANRIIPEFQDPKVGEDIIGGQMAWEEIKTGEYLFAKGYQPGVIWNWVFKIRPDGENTRLMVRMKIQVPEEMDTPVVSFILNAGSFIMEKQMLDGIKDRAEGRFEPAWIETLEIVLWLTVLICGKLAALAFINRNRWQMPIAIGAISAASLLFFTYGQPPIYLRILLVLVLIGGIVKIYLWKALTGRK